MTYPTGVQLATLTFSNPTTFLGNSATRTEMTVHTSAGVVWSLTGEPIDDFDETVAPGPGMPGSLTVPFVDQPGFTDQAGNNFTMWAYTVTRRTVFGNSAKTVTKHWQPVLGQSEAIDFDQLPGGSIGLPVSAVVVPVTSVAGETGVVGAESLAGALVEFLPEAEPITPEAVEANLPERLETTALNATYALKADVGGGIDPVATVAGFGDSMLADHGGLGLTTLGVLAQALGVSVYGGGVAGQSSTEIALRQGGLDVFLTVAGNTIPASGAVGITVAVPTGVWKTGSAWTFAGSLAGIPGTLAKSTTDVWTFTRTTAGTATTVLPETRWLSSLGTTYANRVQIFRAGRNNATDENIVARDVLAMTKGMSAAKPRYIVLPVYNTTSQPSGSAGYIDVQQINTKLAETHGPNYYDLRGWIIRNGLAAAGITPTADDTTAIAEDRIPPSLMHDSTHLNKIGRTVEGNRIAALMVQKGWFPSYTAVGQPAPSGSITVTNRVSNPRAALNTFTWTTTAGTGATASGALVTTGGPLSAAPSFYRGTWTVAGTGQAQIGNGSSTTNLVTASTAMRASEYVRVSWAGARVYLSIGWYNGATFLSSSSGEILDISANTWTPLEAVGTAPATATRATVTVLVRTDGVLPPVGATVDASAVMLHDSVAGDYSVPYRDGDSFDWSWTGTAHGSPSSGPVTLG